MTTQAVCVECEAVIEYNDDPWRRSWFDPNVVDYDNNGTHCPETSGDHIPLYVIEELP